MKHDNNFDLLRLFAATEVMLSHAIEHLKLPVWPWVVEIILMFPGVPIFFVISGFLITETFLRRDGAAVPYFINRALRIYPALWLNLLLIFAIMVAFGVLNVEAFGQNLVKLTLGLAATGSMLLAAAFAGPVPLSWNAALPFWPGGALWTIAVELGFYLMVPVVFLRPFRRNYKVALLSLGCFAVISYVIDIYVQASSFNLLKFASPFAYFWVFAIGSACSLTWPKIKFLFEEKLFYWLMVFFGVYLYLRFSGGFPRLPDYQSPGFATTSLVAILAGLTMSFAFSHRSWSHVLRRQDISYGVYLHHMPIMMLFMAFGLTGSIGILPVFLAVVFAVAALSWFGLERWVLELKRRKVAIARVAPPFLQQSSEA